MIATYRTEQYLEAALIERAEAEAEKAAKAAKRAG
jgi:hypothetical protein